MKCRAFLGFLIASAGVAHAQMGQVARVTVAPTVAAYQGPGDVGPAATSWYGLRAYSAAYAAPGTNKAINIRRASDNATTDIVILTTGKLDVATATTFCASTSCFITKAYDQTGNGKDVTQATSGTQPGLTLACLNGSTLPCMTLSGSQYLAVSISSTAVPNSYSVVAESTTNADTAILSTYVSGGSNIGWDPGSANLATIYGGIHLNAAAADNALHAMQGVLNASSSTLNVDGTSTTGDSGPSATGTTLTLGGNGAGANLMHGYIGEGGYYASTALTSGNITALHSNQSAFWGTP